MKTSQQKLPHSLDNQVTIPRSYEMKNCARVYSKAQYFISYEPAKQGLPHHRAIRREVPKRLRDGAADQYFDLELSALCGRIKESGCEFPCEE